MAAIGDRLKICLSDCRTLSSLLAELEDIFGASGRAPSRDDRAERLRAWIEQLESLEDDFRENANIAKMKLVVSGPDETCRGLVVESGTTTSTVERDGSKFKVTRQGLPPIDALASAFPDLKTALEALTQSSTTARDYTLFMEDIDTNCLVRDPINPTLENNYRRIAIDGRVDALITINPNYPGDAPDIKLLGPSEATDPLYENLRRNIENDRWNPFDGTPSVSSFVFNLTNLLGLDALPTKEEKNTNSVEIFQKSCAICFDNLEGSSIHATSCQRPNCLQNYHTDCLRQWLMAVSNNIRFNTIHGECPSCCFPISCAITSAPL